MNLSYFFSVFIMGTFKYLFSHWFAFGLTVGFDDVEPSFVSVFIPTISGAIVSMAFFYFLSDFLMEQAAKKRHKRYHEALDSGIPIKVKKKFTKTNKFLVKIKSKLGIYAFTFLVPLFLSIPLGSVLCAKFYGHKKKTFPLMVLNMSIYGLIMTSIILLTNG